MLDLVLLLMTPPLIAIGLWLYDRDYRLFGGTRAAGVFGVLLAFFMPFLALGYSMPLFPSPERPIQYVGYGLMVFGVGAGLLVAWRFKSARQVVGMQANRLSISGPYRYSRNPQYVLTVLFPIGYALTWHSWSAWVAVLMFLVVVHVTVLIEERHLARVFGQEYLDYKATTPRYLI